MRVELITMFHCRFILFFCMVAILCICLCVGSSHMKNCEEKERQALLKLKAGFTNGRESLSSWKGEYCCKWKGISCDDLTGHVTMLDLQSSDYYARLQGKIDSSICELKHLTSLNLSANYLEGKIPNCIGSLGQLIDLNLARNELFGVISPNLGNLSNLQTLDLRRNELVGVIPPTLGNLSSLQTLDLRHNKLVGLIPPTLENLSNLQILDLRHNELVGVIPPTLGNLSNLKTLFLGYNGLVSNDLEWVSHLSNLRRLGLLNTTHSGAVDWLSSISKIPSLLELHLDNCGLGQVNPKNIPHLNSSTSLKTLSLSHNELDSSILSWVHNVSKVLRDINLSFNQLSGSVPIFEVTNLASLEYLDLSFNQLKGTLPYTIGQFSSLKGLYLSSVELNGVISEAHLSNLSSLKILDVSHNSISFNLSSDWIPPFQLHGLFASWCNLGPNFPAWLKHQTKLGELEISNSGISDSFPHWFWDQSSSLFYLNVSHNKLSGILPKSLPNMEPTSPPGTWDFSFNNLTGSIPHFPESIGTLILSNNMFQESLSSFCTTPLLYLTILDLSHNLLAGPLSDCWGKFQRLEVLNLANNNFSGRIPNSFGSLQQIGRIHLNNNEFSGEIPSLALCSKLTFIDFGDNNLEGSLPTWVGHNLQHLIVLRLRANNFEGNIPASLCNLLFLQVLDLSENKIAGKIPQCLSHIIALSNSKFPRKTMLYTKSRYFNYYSDEFVFFDEATLAWKGKDREYGKILGLMTSIDLSCNHLTGEIPQSMTMLVALAGLNLSENNLTGLIPSNIGHMQMLESLDLSKNHLYGRMPSSFSNLTFLSYMNLSCNNLSGKIPVSTQLQSFDASTYEGNNGLCGSPLTNHCPGDVISTTGSTNKNDTNEDEDELITIGFYICLGFGFFVGFWGVCGTLLIKTSWRHAYFRFFNNTYDWMYVSLVVFIAKMKRKFKVQD